MKRYNGKSGQVNAGKITDITAVEKQMIVDGSRVDQSEEWKRQNNPQIGDWYVQDDNGARIMSTADFKAEFEQVADRTIPTAQNADANRLSRDERAKAAADRPTTPEQKAADNLRASQEEKAQKAVEDAAEKERRRQRALSTPQGVQAQENAKHELDRLEQESGQRPA
jgi:hypothetical protein